MNKRGMELATSTIIMVLVGLIVLAIVIVLVRQQATKGAQGYNEYTGATDPKNLDKCANFILGRKCIPAADCTDANGMRQAPGVFPDCAQTCCKPK